MKPGGFELPPQSYERPAHAWYCRVINWMLGPVPPGQVRIDSILFAKKADRSYRLLAFMMVLATWVWAVLLLAAVPWTRLNILGFFTTSSEAQEEVSISGALVFVMVIGFIIWHLLVDHKGTESHYKERTIMAEQRFRQGSEKWTTRQRLTSNVAFGLCQLANVFFPLVSIPVMTSVGIVLTAVYLREYGRCRSDPARSDAECAKWATMQSARLRYQYSMYNLAGLTLFVTVFGLLAIADLLFAFV